MAVTTTVVHQDVGEVWDAIEGTTTTIVEGLIDRAEAIVKLKSSTTTGYDVCIRPLAAKFICQNVMGGLDPVSKSIGPLSVGEKNLPYMIDKFNDEFEMAMKLKGYTVDGHSIIFEVVNG